MLNVGLFELIFFVSFALIFLGPEKLVNLLKSSYQFYQKLRQLLHNVQTDLERELKLNELQNTLESEIDKVRDLERILSQKIQQDLCDTNPIYVSLPYHDLGGIRSLEPNPRRAFECVPLSYSELNQKLDNYIS
jgi:Tat protein translocase TatB subunit